MLSVSSRRLGAALPGQDEQRASGSARRRRSKAASSWGIRFAALRCPQQAITGKWPSGSKPLAGFDVRPRGHRDHADRALRSRTPSPSAPTYREWQITPSACIEHLPGQREVLRPLLPDRREHVVDHAVREQPSDHSGVLLHRVEVAGASCLARSSFRRRDGGGRSRGERRRPAPLERVDDPRVRLGAVSDVIEGDIGSARRVASSPRDDDDVEPLSKRREQERAVVGDPRAFRREGREVRDLQELRSRSTTASHVMRSAVRFPERPHARACSGFAASHVQAEAMAAGAGLADEAVLPSTTTSSGPPASRVVTTGFSGEERLVRDETEVLVDRRVEDGEAVRIEVDELVVADAIRRR